MSAGCPKCKQDPPNAVPWPLPRRGAVAAPLAARESARKGGRQSTIRSRAAKTVSSAVSVTVRRTGPGVFKVTVNVALP